MDSAVQTVERVRKTNDSYVFQKKKEAFKNEYCKICIDEANYFFLFFVRIIVDVREMKLRNEKKPKFYFIKMVYNRVKFLLKESSLIFVCSYSKPRQERKLKLTC